MSKTECDNEDIKHPICVVPPEQHYNSYKDLLHDIIYYEQRRASFYVENPYFKPPKGKFEIVRDLANNRLILLPTSIDYGVLYRGQTEYYKRCIPTIFRSEMSEIELFIEYVRIAEFKQMIDQYGITERFNNDKLYVDYVGLAQHYGLKTNVLDLTSDIKVALFFAMCDYESETKSYKAKSDEKIYIGYVYATLTYDTHASKNNSYGLFSHRVKVIGMQPFKRPGLQKGFAYHMEDHDNFYGYLYSFNYTKEDSLEIYNYFDKGKALWCKDKIADYTEMIKQSKEFSYNAVRATSLLERFNSFSTTKRVSQLKKMGIKIIPQKELPWANTGVPCDNQQWLNIKKDLVQRQVITEGKKYSCVCTKHIGREIMLNYFYGCTDSPIGYDSGISFIENKKAPYWGIEYNTNHIPMVPDISDEIIHPNWKSYSKVAPCERSFDVPGYFHPKIVKRTITE